MNPLGIIKSFQKATVLVIGDIMLDKYIIGAVDRISPEAPIQVVNVKEEKHVPGGAANVANNVSALGAKAYIVGILGKDHAKDFLLVELEKRGIDCSGIVVSDSMPTIQKIRIVAQHQQLVRLDYEKKDNTVEDEICENIKNLVPKADIIIVSDYAKGAITEKIISQLKEQAARYDKKIIVDPKPAHSTLYQDTYLVKPNKKETEEICSMKVSDESSAVQAGSCLIDKLHSNILMTLGDKGMYVFEKNNGCKYAHLPTQAREVYDVSGAGDTVIATLALGIATGADLVQSAQIANHAAGIVVGKLGTATVSTAELCAVFENENRKIRHADEMLDIMTRLKKEKKKIVFTNGCFDILHAGHLQLLRKARTFGDILIVGLNTDSSIQRIKGPKRPVIPQDERSEMLSGLECVDYVVLFDEDTPCEIISKLQPDIHVKGGDYDPQDYKNMPEARIVHEYGGEVKIVNLIDGKSTTNIIRKVVDAYSKA